MGEGPDGRLVAIGEGAGERRQLDGNGKPIFGQPNWERGAGRSRSNSRSGAAGLGLGGGGRQRSGRSVGAIGHPDFDEQTSLMPQFMMPQTAGGNVQD